MKIDLGFSRAASYVFFIYSMQDMYDIYRNINTSHLEKAVYYLSSYKIVKFSNPTETSELFQNVLHCMILRKTLRQ